MIQVDPLLLSAFRYSHTRVCSISVYDGATLVTSDVLISDGTVTADRGQKARRTLDCTIPLTQWEDVADLNVVSCRVQAWSGYDLGGNVVMIPLGVFRVDELGRTQEGELRVTGVSLEAYVIDDIFIDELFIPAGENVILLIQDYITQSLPDAVFELDAWAESNSLVLVPSELTAKRDRWDAITQLASIINCDVYCAPNGSFRIAKKPSMIDPVPVWQISEGSDGVLVSMNTKVGRANTYNAVLVMGQSSDSAIPPCSATAYDDDPTSPTRWGGPFGKKHYVYQDDVVTTGAECLAKADELLAFFKAEDRSLDFSAIPNPAIEPDDVLEVSMLDGTVETHMITKVTIPIGLGEWSAETLSNKVTGVPAALDNFRRIRDVMSGVA